MHVTCMQGVHLTIRGTTKIIYGTVIAACGDNLGSQLLGGYKQLASATRKCRYCMATKDDINTKVYLHLIYTSVWHAKVHVQLYVTMQLWKSTLQCYTLSITVLHQQASLTYQTNVWEALWTTDHNRQGACSQSLWYREKCSSQPAHLLPCGRRPASRCHAWLARRCSQLWTESHVIYLHIWEEDFDSGPAE